MQIWWAAKLRRTWLLGAVAGVAVLLGVLASEWEGPAVPGAAPAPPGPARAQEVAIIGKHEAGGYYPREIRVRRGVPVRIYATSVDVRHELAIEEFGIEEHLDPGQVLTVEFTPERAGRYRILCAYHPAMEGVLVVER